MKVLHMVSGSGGSFYCGNCMRDKVYVGALRTLGVDVTMMPLYLPLNASDYGSPGDTPVFFGAVGLYLRQMVPFLRKAPRWFQKLFDSPSLLHLAAKKAGSTRAKGLGEMTLSMLKGEEGNQQQELKDLIKWLKVPENRPDIIHISNALLIGLAGPLKKETGARIVVSLQDEDVWLDAMFEPFRTQCWETMSEKGKEVDAFVTASDYFADLMHERADYPREKINVIETGIDPDYYKVAEQQNPPVIGYLSRLCPANGLDILVQAFIILHQKGYKDLQLKLSGGYTQDDLAFIDAMTEMLKKENLQSKCEIVEDFFGTERLDFLKGLSLLTVPVPNGEALGLYQLEALASAVPLVQPETGAFPEIIAKTKGGYTYTPNTPEKLAETIAPLLEQPEELRKTGVRGRNSIIEKYNSQNMARNMLSLYKGL